MYVDLICFSGFIVNKIWFVRFPPVTVSATLLELIHGHHHFIASSHSLLLSAGQSRLTLLSYRWNIKEQRYNEHPLFPLGYRDLPPFLAHHSCCQEARRLSGPRGNCFPCILLIYSIYTHCLAKISRILIFHWTHLLWHCFDMFLHRHKIYFHPVLHKIFNKILQWWW